MDGGGDDERRGPRKITEGEFTGWWTWGGVDPFEVLTGPFYSRVIDGEPRCAFRAEARHMNSFGAMHGGCMMTFADFALFSLSQRARGGSQGVTVNLSGDFLGPGHAGEWIEARGEVTRAGQSLTFVRGLLTADGRPMLSFSGVIKAVKRRGPQASEVG
ncbi:PaaI family thioesterase [Caulobacter sp. S45]|uniref:PaaI family thioesterase n=1 Tax=Caulobacter sp. S45 TaxID=1641861 RepID=UPI0015753A8B|nr:PaaI family thioesterase [Caulobacter sp. S45]